LKPNGKIIILCVVNRGNNPEIWIPNENSEEKVLFDKLWNEADKNDLSNIQRYENNERRYFEYLEKYNFKNISVDVLAVLPYAPDSFNATEEMATEQINENRLSEICSVKKAQRLAPNALTDDEYNQLLSMINCRYDTRLEQYKKGEKLWDYCVSTVLAISGVKEA